MTSVLGAVCRSTQYLLPETDKEQRIYEKEHIGMLLLNIPWQWGGEGDELED